MYPSLTEYGVEKGYNELTIHYFQTNVERMYRINGGEWQEYQDKKIRLEIGDQLEARGIDYEGHDSLITTYISNLPNDALNPEAYDGDQSTSTPQLNVDTYISVDSSMWNQKAFVYGVFPHGIIAVGKEGETSLEWKDNLIEIPENTIRLKFGPYIPYMSTSFVSEIYPDSSPIITETKVYPNYNGIEFTKEKYIIGIDYLATALEKKYSLNDGKTWLDYHEPFEVELGTTIKAKAIEIDGTESNVTSYRTTELNDNIGNMAFDNNAKTTTTITQNESKIFTITKELREKTLRVFTSSIPANNSYLKIYNQENIELVSLTLTNQVNAIKIPENGYKVVINAGSSNLTISEINLRPDIENPTVQNPMFEISDAGWNTRKGLDITYPSGYKNEYSLDYGETWEVYKETITITKTTTIFARSVDENGKVVASSSFKITKIDQTEPNIELDLPKSILKGEEYLLPTFYQVGLSGGEPVCRIEEKIIGNTNELEVGDYQIDCSITTGAGINKRISKRIVVEEEIKTVEETLKNPIFTNFIGLDIKKYIALGIK